MTRAAVFLVMAAIAGLRIVQGLDRMDVDKIAPVAFGDVVPTKGGRGEIRVYAATLVTVKTVSLAVALGAVSACLTCHGAVAADPVVVMIEGYPFTLVAAITLGYLHFGVFFV